MSPLIISIAVFLAVAGVVGAVAFLLRGGADQRVEGRLAELTGNRASPGAKDLLKDSGVLYQPLDATQGMIAAFLAKFRGLTLWFQQADTTIAPSRFFMICGILAGAAMTASVVGSLNIAIAIVAALFAGSLP